MKRLRGEVKSIVALTAASSLPSLQNADSFNGISSLWCIQGSCAIVYTSRTIKMQNDMVQRGFFYPFRP